MRYQNSVYPTKEKQNEKKWKAENHHKYIMSGIRTGKTLNESFRTRADSITDNKLSARLNGGRKKFNVNFIVNTNIFLYN